MVFFYAVKSCANEVTTTTSFTYFFRVSFSSVLNRMENIINKKHNTTQIKLSHKIGCDSHNKHYYQTESDEEEKEQGIKNSVQDINVIAIQKKKKIPFYSDTQNMVLKFIHCMVSKIIERERKGVAAAAAVVAIAT